MEGEREGVARAETVEESVHIDSRKNSCKPEERRSLLCRLSGVATIFRTCQALAWCPFCYFSPLFVPLVGNINSTMFVLVARGSGSIHVGWFVLLPSSLN